MARSCDRRLCVAPCRNAHVPPSHVGSVTGLVACPKSAKLAAFQNAVLRFYRRRRRDLPWRWTRDPYRILVSEVMLQQTQVDRVVPKYGLFLARFPTLRSLAKARFADVLRVWLGLGYNGRALRLWQCAREVERSYHGKPPKDVSELQRLPGIGPYTAAAVASFAFGARVPVVDTNVRRVLTRALLGKDDVQPPRVSNLALRALPAAAASQWAQALMDVGALFCKSTPHCPTCPARRACAYALAGRRAAPELKANGSRARFAGSTRFYRGRIMRALSVAGSLRIASLGRQVKEGFGVSDAAWLGCILQGLARDGLIKIDRARNCVRLP